MPQQRIFHAYYRCCNASLDLGSFKAQIGIYHLAVDQLQTLAVAKRLSADNFAIFKGYVLTVPREIFSLNNAVFYGDVFRVPERVLRIENAVFKRGILDILKRILSLKLHIIEPQIDRAHHKILAFGGAVGHFKPVHRPTEFGGNDIAIAHHSVSTFAKCLNTVQFRIGDFDIV